MSFTLEIDFSSHQKYISTFIKKLFEQHGEKINILQESGVIRVEADESSSKLEEILIDLGNRLPYSCFMGNSLHNFSDKPFKYVEAPKRETLQLDLGVCSSCKSSMLNSKSESCYDPYAHCWLCGSQHSLNGERPTIKSEPIELNCGNRVLKASDSLTAKKLFKNAAKLIHSGERLSIKTLFGYREFFIPTIKNSSSDSIVVQIDSSTIEENFSLTKDEASALSSIEKPKIRVATLSSSIKELFGGSVFLKFPDDGFTTLLSFELNELGVDYIAYNEIDDIDSKKCNLNFELPLDFQSDMQLFIVQDNHFITRGERVSFPAHIESKNDTLAVGGNLAAVRQGESHRVDFIDRFSQTITSKLNTMRGSSYEISHSNSHEFTPAHGAVLSALASHNKIGQSAVGVWISGNEVSFHYYSGSKIDTVVPMIEFDGENLVENLTNLRDGSDRLIDNIRLNSSELYEALNTIESEKLPFFKALSTVIGLGSEGFSALDKEAIKFMGKGGTLIDCSLEDSRFNPYSALASTISYKMAGVENSMLAYSFFESLGDYFANTVGQIKRKTKSSHTVLCGEHIAQSSLYSQATQKLGAEPLINRNFPVGADGAVVGGIYL